MGAVADAVSDLGSSVSDAVSSVGDAVQDVGQVVIDEVVQPVVKTVENTVQAALDDPIATAARVTAIAMAPATGGASLQFLPLISAVDTIAKGGSIEDGLKSAAITYAAQGVASEVSGYINSGVDSAAAANTYGTDVGSQQSNMLAAQESGMGTAGDVTGNIAGKIAGGTAAGIVRGQDPLVALTNSGISAGTAAVTDQIPGFDQLSPGQKMAVNATVSATLMGGDPSQALVNAAINAGLNEVGQQIKESNSSGLKAGATGQSESVFDPTFAGTMPTTQPTTTADLANQVIPKGVQVAGPLDSESLNRVDVSGAPIYAESPAAKEYKPPFGYRLLSSTEAGNKPAGSFYDPTSNAWLVPDLEAVAGLQKDLMNPVEDQAIQPKSIEAPKANSTELANQVLPEKPNEVPIADMGEVVITAPKEEAPKEEVAVTDQAYWDAIGIDPTTLSAMPAQQTDPLEGMFSTEPTSLANLSSSLINTPVTTPTSSVKTPSTSGTSNLLSNAALFGGAALGLDALAEANKSTPAAQGYSPQILNWNPRPWESPIDGRAQGQAMLDPRFVAAAKGGLMSLAHGGVTSLGSYSDGGRLLKGPGDGMSDNIPASISNKQPARLADGEFVVPADVVSHLGNGSTEAGANVLYKMMEQVRKARTGNPKQGKQINPKKFIPK